MPVEFGPYKSVYVSQKSPEIAELLRERYVQNFSMQDEIRQRYLELKSAPFAGDQAEKDKLYDTVSSQIDAMTQRGDYENMTMDVAKLARRYQNIATPLGENYTAYQKNKDEQLAAVKAGTLSKRDFDLWEKSTTKVYDPTVEDYVDYEGIRFDESGRVDNDSLYQPTTVAATVDVDSEIIKTLNSLQAVKTGGGTVQKIETRNRTEANPLGVEYVVVNQGQIVERVPPELVEQATAAVLGRADVQSYMDQQAHFNTVAEDEEGLNAALMAEIFRLRESDDPNALAAASNLEKTLYSGELGEKRRAAKNAHYSAEHQRYMEFGSNVRGTNAYGGVDSIDYSAKEMALFKARLSSVVPTSNSIHPGIAGGQQKVVSPLSNAAGVVTEKSANTYIESLGDATTAQMEVLAEDLPNLFYEEDAEGRNTGNTWDTSSIKSFLRTADMASIEDFVNQRDGFLKDNDGTTISKDLAKQKLFAAKEAIEHQDLISNAFYEIRETYLEKSKFTLENNIETFDEEVGSLMDPTRGVSYTQEDILDVLHSYSEFSEDLGERFSKEEILESKERLRSGTSEIVNNINYWNANLGGVEEGSTGRSLNPYNNLIGSISNFDQILNHRKNKAYEMIEVDGKGIMSFPIYSDVPRAVDPELQKQFEEVIKEHGVGTIESMQNAQYVLSNGKIGEPTIKDVLGGAGSPLKITGIGYTRGMDNSGNIKNLVALTMNVGSGNKVTSSETVYVMADEIMNDTGNLAHQFSLNTLDQKIEGDAFKIVNTSPMHFANKGYVDVVFDDGAYTGRGKPSNTNIVVRFPVTKTNTGEAGAFTYSIGTSDITISGQAGGKEIESRKLNRTQYKNQVRDLGASIGRQEDLNANRM